MDLFVFPSLWDGLPNALLEAMACARPAVATAVGGISEVIEDGRSGWLVPLQELDRFAQAVDGVLSLPPENRDAVARAARGRVVRDFTPEAERDALLDLYRGLRTDE
jgi:glycosyltransferase involved in cell wall biosynthesis